MKQKRNLDELAMERYRKPYSQLCPDRKRIINQLYLVQEEVKNGTGSESMERN